MSNASENAPLTGRRVAFVASDGVEQVELTEPMSALKEAGAETVLLTPGGGDFKGYNHLDPADDFTADGDIPKDGDGGFDAIVLPGGVANPDALRMDEDVVGFIRRHAEAGKPIAAICHAPWTLLEAGLARGRRMTSWPSLQTDLVNAGATWVDEETVVDRGILTSRNPDDIPAFNKAAIELFASDEPEAVGAISHADRA